MRTQCREYGLANHLGNVLATVSDAKLPEAKVLSHTDYYAFGGAMPGRSGGAGYRFGFNNQEQDSETKTVHFRFREHDPRIGRFWSVDPLAASYPWNSPYAFAENRVIDGIDLEGAEYLPANTEAIYTLSSFGKVTAGDIVSSNGEAMAFLRGIPVPKPGNTHDDNQREQPSTSGIRVKGEWGQTVRGTYHNEKTVIPERTDTYRIKDMEQNGKFNGYLELVNIAKGFIDAPKKGREANYVAHLVALDKSATLVGASEKYLPKELAGSSEFKTDLANFMVGFDETQLYSKGSIYRDMVIQIGDELFKNQGQIYGGSYQGFIGSVQLHRLPVGPDRGNYPQTMLAPSLVPTKAQKSYEAWKGSKPTLDQATVKPGG